MNTREDILLRETAWNYLLDEYICSLPVDVFNLAERCGYKAITYEKCAKRTGKTIEYLIQECDPLGFVFWSNRENKFIICYNEEFESGVIRWTIMHEISHIVLKHVTPDSPVLTRTRKAERPHIERLADGLTRRVLCPSIVLHDCGAVAVKDIIRLCGISEKAAKYRSDYMKTLEARGKWRSDPLEVKVEKQFEPFIKNYVSVRNFCECALEFMPCVVA